MKHMLRSVVCLLLILPALGFVQTGFAQTGAVGSGLTTSPATQSPSINPGANNAQSSENSAAGANMAAGAALMAACMASMPPMIPLCIMGAAALAQGGADSSAASGSGQSASSSSGATTPATTPTAAAATTTPATASEADGTNGFKSNAAALQALADAGYTVTPTTVTAPDGTSVPTSSIGTASSMSALGFSADQIAVAQKKVADVNAKYGGRVKISSVPTAEGAGGEAPAANNKPTFGLANLLKFSGGKNPFALTNAAKAGMAAGKTVMLDGEPIGVRGDNIFDMIHSCYSRKRERNNFLETPGADVRAPATTMVRPFK